MKKRLMHLAKCIGVALVLISPTYGAAPEAGMAPDDYAIRGTDPELVGLWNRVHEDLRALHRELAEQGVIQKNRMAHVEAYRRRPFAPADKQILLDAVARARVQVPHDWRSIRAVFRLGSSIAPDRELAALARWAIGADKAPVISEQHEEAMYDAIRLLGLQGDGESYSFLAGC
ncbi:MAG: hypothetical protein JXR94_15885, partial [Candidatus Hydrogenedentes bacterium]|nr:hypothetical protein [Candidatus Hydrogenedentota bacterium]